MPLLLCTTVTYLMATMTLGTLSICMTVIILNVHHRGATQRMPDWLRRAAFVYVARLLCVNTPYARDFDDPPFPQPTSSTSPPAAAVNVDISPPSSPIEPIWKRRSDTSKPPPSPPAATKLPPADLPRSCVRRERLELTLKRMFRRSERPQSGVPVCNGCAFVGGDSGALVARRRRLRGVNGGGVSGQTRTNNGRASVPRCLPAQSTDSTSSTRDEVLSPLLKTPRPTATAGRRHSAAAARRLDLAGQCRTDAAAWSTLDSGESSAACRDDDDDDENNDELNEQYAAEWRELARILDRLCFWILTSASHALFLCFWILLVLMTASGFVILLYPKYTGSETDWGSGIT